MNKCVEWFRDARRVSLTLATLLVSACTATVHDKHPNGGLARTGELVRGDQEGPWTYYHPSGRLRAQGSYHGDIQVGPWTYWFENGQKEMEGAFEDERRVGEWSFWHENGQLRARGRFERGFEEGEWEFFSAAGRLERRGRFERGRPVLGWRFAHADGSVAAEGSFWEGTKVGVWRQASEDGTLTETLYPLPGEIEHCVERWDSGALRREGFRRNGRAVASWVSCHQDGKTRLEARFDDGLASGPMRAFREDGTLLASASAERGVLTGELVMADGARVSTSARPPAMWNGSWSSAQLASEASTALVIETWLAELSSPIDPQALRVTKHEPTSRVTTVPAAFAGETSPVSAPARAQPWTVREENEFARYVENYGAGPRAGTLSNARYDEIEWSKEPEGDRERARALLDRPLPRTSFPTADGGTFDLEQCRGRNVVVSVMRGFGGLVCPYCAAQTKALARSVSEFERLGTEVVVVYPGSKAGLEAFLEAYARTFGGERPPYRIVFDSDLELTTALGIEEKLARPTSLILDAAGVVRYAYVGRNIEDRPSAGRLLQVLERVGSPKSDRP